MKIVMGRVLVGGLVAVSLTGCEWFGDAKVQPVVKKGPAMTSLESAIDVDRITALLPPDNSYSNRTTSIAIKVSGTCISGSAAVKVTVANTETKIILACDEQSGTFGTTLDLSSLPDGNVQIEFSFLKAVNSTSPMYVLERRMFKDTESLPAFQVPASLSESSSGMIDIAAVEGAASYKTTFTPTGGGTAIGPIETFVSSVPVTGLVVGTTYAVAVTAFDAAGNDTQASNTGTFIKTGPPNPSGLSATAVSGSQINLAWTSGGGSSAGFVVAYQSGASAPASCAAGTIHPASGKITGTTYSVTDLSATTQYSFRVCAVNNDTTTSASSGVTASVTTLQAPPPNPTSPSATVNSSSQITLSWTSGGGTTTDYRISYQTGATAPATCDAGTKILESSISGVSHAISGLSASTQYSFRICAINGNATPDASGGG